MSFLIKRSKREMSGKLNVKLKNRNGEDEVEFKVVVYDKPSPPIGPLEVSKVSKGYYEEMGFREEGRKDIESKGQIGEGRKGLKEGRVERVCDSYFIYLLASTPPRFSIGPAVPF